MEACQSSGIASLYVFLYSGIDFTVKKPHSIQGLKADKNFEWLSFGAW